MRKIITLSVSIAMFVFLVFSSCTKNDDIKLASENEESTTLSEIVFNYTIKNGILVFDTEDDYGLAIDYLVDLEKVGKIILFNEVLGYESYRSKFLNKESKMEAAKDELFASIINPDCLFGIGKYLFEIDLSNELIDVHYIDNCNYLKSAKEYSLVGRFSFDDDVIGIINGEEQLKSSYCEYKTKNCSFDYTSDAGDISIKVIYIKLGVYNTVKAKIKQGPASHQVNIGLSGSFTFSNRNQSGSSSTSLTGTSNSLTWRPYAKMRRLKKYKADVDFSWDCQNAHDCLGGIKLINECDKNCRTE